MPGPRLPERRGPIEEASLTGAGRSREGDAAAARPGFNKMHLDLHFLDLNNIE
jgi:hypothetical protein